MIRKKSYVKLSSDEKEVIEKISSISGISSNIVKQVFMAVLISFSLKAFSGEYEYDLPYLGKFQISTDKKVTEEGLQLVENYNVTTSSALHQILKQIENKEDVWLMDFFRNEIERLLGDILCINSKILPHSNEATHT